MAPDAEPEGRQLGAGGLGLRDHVDSYDGPALSVLFPQAPNRFQSAGPLRQVAVHRSGDHWHLVTFGLSELDGKESDDPGVSGWGFELTLRLAIERPDDDEVPLWAVDLLANLAAYVWRSGHAFAPGHHLDLRGPIRLGTDCAITAAVVVPDPGVPSFSGPNGEVALLQIVGITAEELEICRLIGTEVFVDVLAGADPELLTRLDRGSITDQPALQARVDQCLAGAGPPAEELRVGVLRWSRRGLRRLPVVQMGSGVATALGPALRRRLVEDADRFRVVGDASQVDFVIGPVPGWSVHGNLLQVTVTPEGVGGLAGLFDGSTGWGRSPELRSVRFRVTP